MFRLVRSAQSDEGARFSSQFIVIFHPLRVAQVCEFAGLQRGHLVQRHGLATRSAASRSSRVFSPSHTTSSSALVATASAAANLLPPGPYLFSRKAANLAWSAALFFDAAFFLPRPPPWLPPPPPRPPHPPSRGRPWQLGSAPWPQQLASGRPARRGYGVATRLHSPTRPPMSPPSHLLGRRADGGSRQAAALPVALDRRRGRRGRSTPKAPSWRRHSSPAQHSALSPGLLAQASLGPHPGLT